MKLLPAIDLLGGRVVTLVQGVKGTQTTEDPQPEKVFERWVEERQYREADPREVLAQLRERRAASLELLASVAPERLVAAAPHRRLGELSGLDLLVAWVAHDRLHLRHLAGTLARLWAIRWAPLKAEYAGPIPYAPGDPV